MNKHHTADRSAIPNDILAQAATEIHAREKNTIADAIEIGRILQETFDRFEHGDRAEYHEWIKTEFRWSERSARNYRGLYAFQIGNSCQFSTLNISVGALYYLADLSQADEDGCHGPDGRPGEEMMPAIDEVLETAKTERVSRRRAEEILKARWERLTAEYLASPKYQEDRAEIAASNAKWEAEQEAERKAERKAERAADEAEQAADPAKRERARKTTLRNYYDKFGLVDSAPSDDERVRLMALSLETGIDQLIDAREADEAAPSIVPEADEADAPSIVPDETCPDCGWNECICNKIVHMTPALNAALVELRDADADPTPAASRGAARLRWYKHVDRRDAAINALCALLNPK